MKADTARVIDVLREMDHQQRVTDEYGGREIAWYWWRGDVEKALGLPSGTLDTGEPDEYIGCTDESHIHDRSEE